MFKIVLVAFVLACPLPFSSAWAQSTTKETSAVMAQARIVSYAPSFKGAASINCKFDTMSQCVDPPVAVVMWKAGTYSGTSHCVAEIQASEIAVPFGIFPATMPHVISWKLAKADPSDSDYYFQVNGIEMGQSADTPAGTPITKRHRVTADDLRDPVPSVDKQTFTWTVVNNKKRVHDPVFGVACFVGFGSFCDIEYVATVTDSTGATCDSVDPTVINGGS